MAKEPPGHFQLLYFASAASYTAKDFETLEAPLPLSTLFNHLEKYYVGIKQKILDSCLVTINLEYVDIPDCEKGDREIVIEAGDEVAIIPPVSSG
jgi:molybdopterin converting factor small subunit